MLSSAPRRQHPLPIEDTQLAPEQSLGIRDGSIVRLPLVGYARISLADLVN